MKKSTSPLVNDNPFCSKLIRVMIMGVILLLPTQLSKHLWPKFSYVLGVRIDYLSPTLYVTDILIISIFILWVINILTRQLSYISNLRRSIATIANHKIVAVFMLYLFLNIIINGSSPESLFGIGKFIEYCFLYYLCTRYLSQNKIKDIAFISTFSVIGESLLAIGQYLNQGSLGGLFYFIGERNFTSDTPGIANASVNGQLILRPYGTLPHPNVLAGYLLFMLIIIYASLRDEKSTKKKVLKLSALIIGSIALILTLSRIVIVLWLTLALLTILMMSLKQKKVLFSNKPTRIYVGAALISILGGMLLSREFFIKLFYRFSQTNLSEESFVQRKDLIQNTFTLISKHPLVGIGLNNFLPALARIKSSLSPISYLQPVHNIFILWLAEEGIIGGAFLIFFIFLTFRRLLMLLGRGNAQATPLLAILLSLIIVGSFDHYLLTLQQGQLLTVLMLSLFSDYKGVSQDQNKKFKS